MQFAENKRPTPPADPSWRLRERPWTMLPYIVLDGAGEAYMDKNMGEFRNRWRCRG